MLETMGIVIKNATSCIISKSKIMTNLPMNIIKGGKPLKAKIGNPLWYKANPNLKAYKIRYSQIWLYIIAKIIHPRWEMEEQATIVFKVVTERPIIAPNTKEIKPKSSKILL